MFFVKIPSFRDFLILQNYFSIRKSIEYEHGPVDRVHSSGA
jgi:hypothetical protein